MLTLRAIPFPIWNPKKGSIFPPQNWGFFLLFFCCCYCTFAPEGWLIFIRISNSGRPTVLTVDSWFVVWLLNNRPALHTGGIRFTYPALKVVLKPISWNHQKALFGPKPLPPYGLVKPNHLIPSTLGPFSHKHNISHPPEEKLRTKSQRWTPLPPGLRTLRWDRLGVFSYTKILLILFFKNAYSIPPGRAQSWKRALRKLPHQLRENNSL